MSDIEYTQMLYEPQTWCTSIIREKLGPECPAVFALTAEALEGDQERFLSLGFDGYLSKPLQVDEVDALQDILKCVKSRA
jgi:CheY-like chemotaxis protein